MAYRYDVFLSYRRHKEWPKWVNNHFLPLFEHYLGEELGRDAHVFLDTSEIESGSVWPYKLAEGLAQSRVLVCLWSRQYFSSPWCVTELAHMRAREDACGHGTPNQPGGLIVPVVIHDGEDFPLEVRHIQVADFQDIVNVHMAPNSATAEELARRVAKWAPDVRAAVHRAPEFDPAWISIAATSFMNVLKPAESQTTVPSLGGK
jgi:hypothetical protein